MMHHISITGIVGVPAKYGGFETLVENLVRYHEAKSLPGALTIYCSSKSFETRPSTYASAHLRYIPLEANGVSSIPYDALSLLSAVWRKSDVILLLGVSGAIVLPLVRIFSKARIVTNIDGIEWRREKWKGLAKWFLRMSEKVAVRYSHDVIADNQAISDYVVKTYGRECQVIAYGGDHALDAVPSDISDLNLSAEYALALCRIEPENNVHMILEAYSRKLSFPLVFVGNWDNSSYGQLLKAKYQNTDNIVLLDPVYDPGRLLSLRKRARIYVHGHSTGGTNPSLVEMMHFGIPVFAYDCLFNRFSTDDKAIFFENSDDLYQKIEDLSEVQSKDIGGYMESLAMELYTWSKVGDSYFSLLGVK